MNSPLIFRRLLPRALSGLLPTIAAAFCAAAPAAPAALIHAELDWIGDLGYEVRAQFTYDNAFTIIGFTPEEGTLGLRNLFVAVRDPAGTLLQDTVNFGRVEGNLYPIYPYLYFSYNPTTQRLVQFLDLGDDSGYFLQGPQFFQLFLSTGTESETSWIPIDHDGSYSVRTVPDAGSTLLLFTVALGGCLAARRALAFRSSRGRQ